MSRPSASYHDTFQQELVRLNPAQREAVHQIEGPVLVIAGPGTGKTHILASRIGHILLTTDTQAQSILCLTFTDAGVRAMRQRLLQLIGPEAHRVHIFTFHSFCNTVIQENLAHFGRQGLEPVTELEQIEISRYLLDQLDIEHPLRRGKIQIHFYEKHLRDLFQLMKTEGWSAADVKRAIQLYLDDLPHRKEFIYQRKHGSYQKGDVKEAQLAKEQQRMEILKAAADLFPAYERRLAQLNRYDYADMILWVLKAFKEDELLLRNYQEQYLYFLIDEYQDTNGAQNELIQQLASFWDNPNLFIVGDDDQSIFEFQGARLKNLVDYYEQYREQIKVVLLQQNYRSTQAILDSAKRVIDYNEQRITRKLHHLGIDKELKAGLLKRRQSDTLPVVNAYPNPFQEEVAIIQSLKAQHEAGIPWREMAVIYARHQQVASLQQMLDKQGIPYQTKRKTNILDTVLIRQIREMLSYLRDEQRQAFSGDYRLFRILHYRCFGLSGIDLAQLAVSLARQSYRERPSWRPWLQQPDQWPSQLGNKTAIIRVAQWWEDTHLLATDTNLTALVEHLLNSSGLLANLLKAPDRLWQVQLAKTFLDFVREEVARKPRLTLEDLLRTFDQMDQNRLALSLRKDIELENGVNLVTAHSSKGLEFHTVFILDATAAAWEGKKRGGNNRFVLPDTLTLSGENFTDETHRRLFYVAMTRAKEQLFISYATQNSKGKDQQLCRFVDEMLGANASSIPYQELPKEELFAYELDLLQTTDRPQLPVMEHSAISKLLEGFQLSVSAWHRYLDCPLRFFYEVVLQAPQIQRPAATFGNAMHNALQRYFNGMLAHSDREFLPSAVLIKLFKEEMQQLKPYFPSDEYERRLEQGERNLQRYYEQFHTSWIQNCRTELNIQQVEIEGVPVKGVIDRIDILDDRQVRIIDYKTGSHNNQKLRSPTEAHPEGGNYWRQLIFYKLLWENKSGETRKVTSAAISYLDIDKHGELTMEEMNFSTEGVKQVKQLLQESYTKILAHEFYTGCGEPNCEWCNFVREDYAPPSYSSEEVEALDD